jgi:phage terminase small subunit
LKSGEPVPRFIPPNDLGGFGFDTQGTPHPQCPHCLGRGNGHTVFKDTRFISPEAAALFAGIKETKDGLEFKFHSKLEAAKELARLLGMYEKDNEQKGAGVAQALASFVSGLHSRGAGRLPIADPKKKPAAKGWTA